MSLLYSFIPWIVLFVWAQFPQMGWFIIALGVWIVHAVLNGPKMVRGKIFDIGAGLYFSLFVIWALVDKELILGQESTLFAYCAMGAIAGFSCLIGKPFTMQYIEDKVSPDMAISYPFWVVNLVLSALWAMIFSLMSFFAWVEFIDFLPKAYIWGIDAVLIVIGVALSSWLPDPLAWSIIQKRFSVNIKHLYKKQYVVDTQETFISSNPLPSANKAVDVLIVGGGPNGLASALLLQMHGLNVMVVEKHPGLSRHPKARLLSCRSMELLRRIGIGEEFGGKALPKDQRWFGWFSTINTPLLGSIYPNTEYEGISPTQPVDVAQPYAEQELYEVFTKRGGSVRFSHELTDIVESKDKVQSIIFDRENKQSVTIDSRYVIAADGVRSTVRNLYGIKMLGPEDINVNVSIYCEMDLDAIIGDNTRCGFAFVMDKKGPAPIVISVDGKKEWVIIFLSSGAKKEKVEALYTTEYINKRIADVIGQEVEVNVLNKQVWVLGSQVINTIQTPRVFFVGDSAHQFSPSGGMGLNTGLQDVDNLMWKVAYVVKGVAHPRILQTYAQERVPAILNTMQWSLDILIIVATLQRVNIDQLIKEGKFQHHVEKQTGQLNKSGIDLGAIYQSPCVVSDQTPPVIPADHYQPHTFPGSRLPHIVLEHQGKTLSSLDLIQTQHIALFYDEDKKYLEEINFSSIPTTFISLGKEYTEKNPGEFAKLAKVAHPVLWVRPDGHIAFRGSLTSAEDKQALQHCLRFMGV